MTRYLGTWLRVLRRLRFALLLAAVVGVICTAAYTSALIVQRQDALGGISRYNLTWSASQSVAEMLRFEDAVAASAIPGANIDQDLVTLRLDILTNRAEVMRQGEAGDVVEQAPELRSLISDLVAAVTAARPLLLQLDRPGTRVRLLNLFAPLNERMAQLAATAHAFSADTIARDQHELGRLHWIFSGLLMALIGCGVGLVALMLQDAGAIRQAHHDLSELTGELAYAAQHDALTGLANRTLFHKQAKAAIDRQARRGDMLAVLFLDLDGFKDVNDTLGHPAGDVLLKEVGRRLTNSMRPSDVVARLGGDEFAALLQPIDHPDQAAMLASRLIETLGAPYTIDGQRVFIGASVGAAIGPHDGRDVDELLKHADIALQRAKHDGRALFRLFHPQMNADLLRKRAIAVELRVALEREEFEVLYQPIVTLGTGRIAGAEALLRWHSPSRGLISPVEFVPIAEDTGLIRQIGAWVLREACAEAARWPEHLKVAVNLSPKQFTGGDLVADVWAALDESGLAPSRLELEVTESVLLQDSPAVLDTLHRLRAMDVRIALDDFGTGYSSLSYLQTFPFDKIKIDQSFVRDLAVRTNSLCIVVSVVTLARDLGMITTAEGIETEEQLSRLRSAGCTEGQGFLFQRPVPRDHFLRLIAQPSPELAA